MPSIFDHFSFRRLKKTFQNWPAPSSPKPVLASDLDTFQVQSFPDPPDHGDDSLESQNYSPVMVIGLGATGNQVIQQWLEQMAYTQASSQQPLRAVILCQHEESPLPESRVQARRLRLVDSNVGVQVYRRSRIGNRRGEMRSLFQQTHNISRFQGWLKSCQDDLKGNMRVFLIASLADPMIGVLGDVLQILRLQPGRNNPYKDISALLTSALPSLEGSLEQGEIYAALREITRMTVGGIHILKSLPNLPGEVYHSALLDYPFLIGTGSGFPGALDLASVPFNQGVGQALAEILYTLTHPSANLIWQHFKNVYRPGKATVQTAGIATLHVPISEIQDYVAARLAYAAFYGERIDRPKEGLLSQGDRSPDHQDKASLLARRWLLEGPSTHPFFDWLLTITHPADMEFLPSLEVKEYEGVFQTQLAHGLTQFLNEPTESDQLKQVQAVLGWLEDRVVKLIKWLKDAPSADQNEPNHPALLDLLNSFQAVLVSLKKQVQNWENVMGLSSLRADVSSAHHQASDWRTAIASRSSDSDWRRQDSQVSTDWRDPKITSGTAAENTVSSNLLDLLRSWREDAERTLAEVAHGQTRRAITADGRNDLTEVESYYVDTIRPELSQHSLKNSNAFTRVRERLTWWVNTVPGKLPELLLICIPPHHTGEKISIDVRFTPHDVEKLANVIHNIALAQAAGCADDLAGDWFKQRLGQEVGFFKRADSPLLKYGHRQDTENLYYLIASDKDRTGEFKDVIFRASRNMVNELERSETSRFTAFSLWTNIPINSVETVETAYASYRHREKLHLYIQERLAAVYERRIRSLLDLGRVIIPSDLTLGFTNPKLVTLFCQALFGNLITLKVKSDNLPYWSLDPIGDFEPLTLAPGEIKDPKSLGEAFKKFTLELPNEPGLEHEINPAKHFGVNRANFLKALHQTTYQQRSQPEFPQCSDKLITYIEKWQYREDDEFIRAFAALLAVELREPVWEDWESIEEIE